MFNVSVIDSIKNDSETVVNTKNLSIALKIGLLTAFSYSISKKPHCLKKICKNKSIHIIYTDTDFWILVKWVNINKYTYLGININ